VTAAAFPGVAEALRARFSAPQYVWLEEVRDRPGFNHRRAADGIAMAVWESRGLELEGVEVKASRADWLREVRDPGKADAIYRYVDRFWLAVEREDVVRPGELPKTWGLLVPRGDKLVVEVQAPRLKPKPLSRGLLAMMLRRAAQRVPIEQELADEIRKKLTEAERESWMEHGRRVAEAKVRELTAAVQDFERQSGVRIDLYNGGKIGDAVAAVLRGDHHGLRSRLNCARRDAQSALAALDHALREDGPIPDDAPEPT
jgi:hypothetical protein